MRLQLRYARSPSGTDTPLAGATLADAGTIAGAGTVLEPDRRYIVAVDPTDFDEVVGLLSGTVRTVGGGP